MPEVSVVVPAHRRPVRLRWLLHALEQQTLDRGRFEVVVAHDSDDAEVASVVREHPLAEDGTLRPLPVDHTLHAVKRNRAWSAARAPVVLFTDDDCRPPEDWLERALAAAGSHPGAIVQGRTQPDPDEQWITHAPHHLTQRIDPPTESGQTCNILYPLELLERLGGFDETVDVLTGEDTDMLWRAQKAGAPYVGAADMLTYHAVSDVTLVGRLRAIPRWGDLPLLFRRHPELRKGRPLRIFWKDTHPTFLLGLAGVAAATARRDRRFALLVLPWMRVRWPWHSPFPWQPGFHLRGFVRSLAELPARAAIDATEIAVLARGSIKHRSLFL